MKWSTVLATCAVVVGLLLATSPVSAREPITTEGAAKALIQIEAQAYRNAARADAGQPSPTAPSASSAVQDGSEPPAAYQPGSAYGHVVQAIEFADHNDVGSAFSEVDAALGQDPGLAEGYLVRGVLHQDRGNYEAAVNDFTLVTQIPPPISDAYRLRAAAQANLGRYAEALADLEKAIELDAENVEAYMTRATLYQFVLGQEANALLDYDRVIELAPSTLPALNNRAILLTLRGEHSTALADIDAYARYNNAVLPSHVLDTRGYIHLRRGDFASAVADFEAAIDGGLNPVYPTLGMGIAFTEMGDMGRAVPLLMDGLARVQGVSNMDGQLTDLVRRARAIIAAQ